MTGLSACARFFANENMIISPVRPPLLDRLRATLSPLMRGWLLALWLLGFVEVFFPSAFLPRAREILMAAALAMSVTFARRGTLLIIAPILAGGVAMAVFRGDFAVFTNAAAVPLVFSLFLPVLILIRETADLGPEVAAVRRNMLETPPARRRTGMMLGGMLLGSVLTLGAVSLTSALYRDEEREKARRRGALAMSRGLAMAFPWSPFTVGMSFTLAYLPELRLAEVMAVGAAFSAVGLFVSSALLERKFGASNMLNGAKMFRPAAIPFGILILAVAAVASLSEWTTVQSIAITAPILCLGRLFTQGGGKLAQACAASYRKLDSLSDEFLLFASAGLLGQIIAHGGADDFLAELFNAQGGGLLPYLFALLAISCILSMAGFHSIAVGAVAAALLTPVSRAIPDVIEAQFVLFSWLSATMMSYASLTILFGARMFRVPMRRLIFSENLLFMAAMSALLLAVSAVIL